MNLLELVQVSEEKRDPDWENQFFVAISQSNLKVLSADAQTGPDNWPYILTQTDGATDEPAQKVMQWCAMKGIGLVVNPHKEYPDYVFTYGMLWHFKETGLFYKTADAAPTGSFELTAGVKLHSGPPSPEYLPIYVRNILREFFRDQGVLKPLILVLSTDRKHYDLAFSLESLGDPDEKEHEGIAEAISWFLPPHYSVLLVSEESLPDFIDL